MTKIADAILDTFKELVWDSIVEVALQELFQIKFLAWGPLKAFITWVALRFSEKLYKALSKMVNLRIIVLQNEEFHREYAKSSIVLSTIANQSGIESQEFKKARNENKDHLQPFVRYAIARAA